MTHAMLWNAERQKFRCRWGSCGHEVTWDQMNDAGYTATVEHVVFISEEDFDGPQTN